jgi:hypothetical protein
VAAPSKDVVPLPAPIDGGPSKDFIAYLQGYGQDFTPQPAPAGTADWHAAIAGFPFPDATVDSAIYGVVRCVNPALRCATRGLARPGQLVPIWVVTFVAAAAQNGCPAWATVDARTGAFINGNGPPC